MTLSVFQGRGDILGGTPVTLTGTVLDMTACSDDFADGILGPLWVDLASGGGIVTELGAARALELDTQSSAGATVGVRSVATGTYLDVEATFATQLCSLPSGGTATVGLALYSSAGEFRLDLETTRLGTRLRVTSTVGGTYETQVVGVGTVTLRLVRAASRVLGFVNGQQVADKTWLTVAAAYEFVARNDAVFNSRVRVQVTSYLRRPAVLFGVEPVRIYELTSPHVVVSTPAVERPMVVDIAVHGCASTETVVDGFTYLAEDRHIVGRWATATMVLLNDPVLREG